MKFNFTKVKIHKREQKQYHGLETAGNRDGGVDGTYVENYEAAVINTNVISRIRLCLHVREDVPHL